MGPATFKVRLLEPGRCGGVVRRVMQFNCDPAPVPPLLFHFMRSVRCLMREC